MFNFRYKKYSPIGLDLGTRAFRAVQLQRQKDDLHIHAALEVERPDDQLLPNQDENTDNLAEHVSQIEHLLERGGFVGRQVVLHCPADKLDLRPLKLPGGATSLPRQAILGAIQLQVAGHLPFPVEQAVFDYYPIEDGIEKDHITVMAVTADGQWIKERVRLLQAISLQCVQVDAFPCVLARLTPGDTVNRIAFSRGQIPQTQENPKPEEKVIAYLDMGYRGSTLIVRNQIGPIFCRRFSLGGKELTELLSQRLLVDYQKAERLKKSYGLNCQTRRLRLNTHAADAENSTMDTGTAVLEADPQPAMEIAKTIYAALQHDLGNYVEGLIRALNYVIHELNGTPLEKVVLCGSASHLNHLDIFLQDQFEIPVQRCSHPLLEEIMDSSPSTRAFSGSWTTALGLALAREI
jgi:Tfp pilus assembly PilM family ATPase